jgi:hypothetical protein
MLKLTVTCIVTAVSSPTAMMIGIGDARILLNMAGQFGNYKVARASRLLGCTMEM